MPARCPYCESELKRPPKRAAACPHCRKQVYVRSRQTLFPSLLVTEEQALAVDTFAHLRANFGATEEEYWKIRDELTRISGQPVPSTIVVLGLLEAHARRTTSKNPQAYVEQAKIVARLGGDPRPRLREAMRLRIELEHRPSRVVGGVRVLASYACCEECRAQHGDEYTIDEALEKMPLPFAGCTRRIYGPYPFCICTYTSVLKPVNDWA